MSDINDLIANGVKPPDIDPIRDMGQAMSLRQMGQNYQIGQQTLQENQQKLQQQQRDMQDQQLMKQAYGDAYGKLAQDPTMDVTGEIRKSIAGKVSAPTQQAFETQALERAKSIAAMDKDTIANHKVHTDAIANAGQALLSLPDDQFAAQYPVARAMLIQNGHATENDIPVNPDRTWVRLHTGLAIDADKQLTLAQTNQKNYNDALNAWQKANTADLAPGQTRVGPPPGPPPDPTAFGLPANYSNVNTPSAAPASQPMSALAGGTPPTQPAPPPMAMGGGLPAPPTMPAGAITQNPFGAPAAAPASPAPAAPQQDPNDPLGLLASAPAQSAPPASQPAMSRPASPVGVIATGGPLRPTNIAEMALLANDPKQTSEDRKKYADAVAAAKPVINAAVPGLGPGTPSAANPQAMGEDYLKLLPPGTAAQVRQIVNGSIQFPPFGSRGASSGLRDAVLRYDPDFSELRWKARNAFAPGTKEGSNTLNLNTGIVHLDMLKQLADALDNGSFRPGNALDNAFKTMFGKSAPSNYAALRAAVAGEMDRGLHGTSTIEGRQEILDTMPTKAAPGQFGGIVGTNVNTLGTKLQQKLEQYQQYEPTDKTWTPITPSAQAVLDKYKSSGGQAVGPIPKTLSQSDVGKVYVNRNGKSLRITAVNPKDGTQFRSEEVQ